MFRFYNKKQKRRFNHGEYIKKDRKGKWWAQTDSFRAHPKWKADIFELKDMILMKIT